MVESTLGLFGFVVVTGLVHGAEPGHGWPIAATYALERPVPMAYGVLAGTVIGVGHLVSSFAVVLGFFWLKSTVGLQDGPWLNYVAGTLLIGLGVYEYVTGGHSHDHGDGHDDDHDHHGHDDARDHGHDHGGHGHSHEDRDQGHGHGRDGGDGGEPLDGLPSWVPILGDGHGHLSEDDASRGLWGIGWAAFVLGFAHEEEFELIGICTGTSHCVELTVAYAVSVVVALVGLTALLLAGYERYEDRVAGYAEHFPTVTAAVLVGMGVGFLLGVF